MGCEILEYICNSERDKTYMDRFCCGIREIQLSTKNQHSVSSLKIRDLHGAKSKHDMTDEYDGNIHNTERIKQLFLYHRTCTIYFDHAYK
jgi:hypothetical protein